MRKKNRGHIKGIDKKITAYHEAGHALVSLNVLPNDKVSKVTIIPTTKGAGGYTLSIPEDTLYQNKGLFKKKNHGTSWWKSCRRNHIW